MRCGAAPRGDEASSDCPGEAADDEGEAVLWGSGAGAAGPEGCCSTVAISSTAKDPADMQLTSGLSALGMQVVASLFALHELKCSSGVHTLIQVCH